jgi:DNA primase
MNRDARLLIEFVEQDFGIMGSNKYYRAVEHDSLVVDIDNGVFFWNSKGIYGKPLDYLMKIRKMRYTDALDLVNLSTGKLPIYSAPQKIEVPVKTTAEIFYHNGKNKRDYWYRRLLTDETIDKFHLGYYDGWYTIPIYEYDRLLNIQMRRDEPEKKIRPYYKTGKSELFNFEILDNTKNVVICEGIVDAILLNQFSIPAISKMGGAGSWRPEWYEKFLGVENIYLIFDNDKAGINGAKKIAEWLGVYRCKVFTFTGFDEKYDVIDYFKDGHKIDEFINLVKDGSYYAFEIS